MDQSKYSEITMEQFAQLLRSGSNPILYWNGKSITAYKQK